MRKLLPILLCAVVAAVIIVAVVASWLVSDHLEGVQDAYALDWASAMVASYVDRHEHRPPGSWDDLRPEFDLLSERDKSWTFDEIRSRVIIDFERVSHAAKGKKIESDFVRTVSGRGHRWTSPDPNERIRECFVKDQITSPAFR